MARNQFQSTHSRRVRRNTSLSTSISSCFNPRTHEECDLQHHCPMKQLVVVSIHALTKSATKACCWFAINDPVSIHALTKSATACLRHIRSVLRMFQSTHSRRVRLLFLLCSLFPKWVSIHALTKSATFRSYSWIKSKNKFQSTHSRRVRPL